MRVELFAFTVPVPFVDFAFWQPQSLRKLLQVAGLGPVGLLLEFLLEQDLLLVGQSLAALLRHCIIKVALFVLENGRHEPVHI